MIFTTAAATCFALPCVSALIAAQGNRPSHGNHSGVVKMPVHRKPADISGNGATRRQIDIGLENPFYGLAYFVTLELGTPPQPVVVVLDTGSDELWVNPDCTTASFAAGVAFCQANPVFNPALSSTASEYAPLSPFDLEYGKGFATGNYYLDTVTVGGVPVVTSLFGVATASGSADAGIWGVSYGYPLVTPYYTVLDLMALDGIIQSRAFSLDIANVDSAEGAIIFGGIDTKKYIGALEKLPIIPYFDAPDGFPRYWVYMSSFGVTRNGNAVRLSATVYEQAVFLDSGTTLSFLPANIVANLVTYFPEATASGSLYIVPCSLRSEASTIDFGFGNTIIHVPFHEAIWQTGSTCVLGVGAAAAGSANWVLGDTMLRGAYVVYDQDNDNVLLAPAANCGSNVIPISYGVDAVPSVTGACTAAATSSAPSSSHAGTSTSSLKSSSSTKKTSSSSSRLSSTTSTITSTSSILSSKSPVLSSSTSSAVKSTSSVLSSTSSIKVSFTTSPIKSTSSVLSSTPSSSVSKTTSTIPSSSPSTGTSTESSSFISSTKSSSLTLSSKMTSSSAHSSSLQSSSIVSSTKPPSSTLSSSSSSSSAHSPVSLQISSSTKTSSVLSSTFSSSSSIIKSSTVSSSSKSSIPVSPSTSSSIVNSITPSSSKASSTSAKVSSSSSSSTVIVSVVTVTKTKTVTLMPTGTCTAVGQIYR